MQPEYLIDSVIFIDHLRGIKTATNWLSELSKDQACISVITRAEVKAGAKSEELSEIGLLVDSYACLEIDQNVADKAAELRRTFKWRLPDAFQAAIATSQKIKLATRNTKEFDQNKHEFVFVPYRL